MWVLKFKSREEFNLYNERCMKFKVKIYFYSMDYYVEKDKIYFINAGILFGEEKDKNSFFRDLKKDKQIKNLEVNGDSFISIYSEKKSSLRVEALKTIYNKKIIFLKPTVFDEEGFEEWEVGSFDRKNLEKIVEFSKKLQKRFGKGIFQLLKLKEEKIDSLILPSIVPNLSSQQKKVLDLAIEKGYYNYPRKIKVEDLAKILNISRSTCQFHLAKAEAKMIPFLAKKY